MALYLCDVMGGAAEGVHPGLNPRFDGRGPQLREAKVNNRLKVLATVAKVSCAKMRVALTLNCLAYQIRYVWLKFEF